MINFEILNAIGLSLTFMGVLLGIISLGVIFLIIKRTPKKDRGELIEMAVLILAWGIYIALNIGIATSPDYKPVILYYSIPHFISAILGTIVIVVFLFLFKQLKEVFDRKLLILSGIFAVLSLILRIFNPIILNVYLSLVQRIILLIPPLIGLLMIIKFEIKKKR